MRPYACLVPAERDLTVLLSTLEPVRVPGEFVFATVPEVPSGARPVVTVREAEGITLVLERGEADALGLDYDYVAGMVTLRVHSSLEAVGLTAAVSSELAAFGISANVVAGYFHDHLFVPAADADGVVDLLADLARRAG